jgi:hypothetical protein
MNSFHIITPINNLLYFINIYLFFKVKHLIEILLSQIKWTQGEEVQSTYIS